LQGSASAEDFIYARGTSLIVVRSFEQGLNPRDRAAARRPGLHALLRTMDREVFLVLSLTCCTVLGLLFSSGLVGADSWLSLLSGRIVISHGLPHRDLLTIWGHGRRWVDQQWLAHVAIYGLFKVGGLRLLVLVTLAATLSSVGSLLVLARSVGASARAAAIAAIPVFLLILPATAVRAQTFAYPLFAAVAWLLWRPRNRPSSARLAATLPLLVVWANVHGSVLLGAGLVTLAAAEAAVRRRDPRLIPLVFAPTAAALASPYGVELVRYYRQVLVNPSFGRYITEWQAPSIRQQTLFFVVALTATALVAARCSRFATSELIAFALTTIGGFLAVRNIVWFALLMLFLLPRSFEIDRGRHSNERHPRLNLALISLGALVVVTLTVATASRSARALSPAYRPAALTAVRRAVALHPGAPIWSDEQFADWLLFNLPFARGRVVFDARFELLTGSEFISMWSVRNHAGARWSAPLRNVGTLVVQRSALGNVRELVACRTGRVVYSDPSLVVASLNASTRRASHRDC
jgi:hypothetical protein